jgi:hypothetical protein
MLEMKNDWDPVLPLKERAIDEYTYQTLQDNYNKDMIDSWDGYSPFLLL